MKLFVVVSCYQLIVAYLFDRFAVPTLSLNYWNEADVYVFSLFITVDIPPDDVLFSEITTGERIASFKELSFVSCSDVLWKMNNQTVKHINIITLHTVNLSETLPKSL